MTVARSPSPGTPSRRLTVARRRRPFGLDAPRPPDLGRMEAAILRWLAAKVPDVTPLRVLPPHSRGGDAAEGARHPRLLALLLPDARVAVLRIEARSVELGPDALALADLCRRRRISLSTAATVDEARQALRRLGFEPQNR